MVHELDKVVAGDDAGRDDVVKGGHGCGSLAEPERTRRKSVMGGCGALELSGERRKRNLRTCGRKSKRARAG